MDWQEISRALARMEYPFPQAAAEEALARWDELGAHFIAEIERVAAGGSTDGDAETGEWNGLFAFASYLAAEKRDTRAYAPLVRSCHCPEERAEALFGDDVGTQLGRLLAAVCDGNLAPLKALAEDEEAGMWCRFSAVRALTVCVFENNADREEIQAYLFALCEREAANGRRRWATAQGNSADDLLTWATGSLAELGPHAWMEQIRAWFREGLIDPSVYGLAWIEEMGALTLAECLDEAALNLDNTSFFDALDELSRWHCYAPPRPEAATKPVIRLKDYPGFSTATAWPPALPVAPIASIAPIHATPKVGRNDPCPCGSGKKFKKCCDKADAQAQEATSVNEDKGGAINRAIAWLTSYHGKALKKAIEALIYGELSPAEQDELSRVDDDTWNGTQINAMEWLLAEGCIVVKGEPRNVADMLLGPGGPALNPAQRGWIEKLRSQPLRVYNVTEVMPGVGMRLCDALDVAAPPLLVKERSGSSTLRQGTLLGARVLSVAGQLELSGAGYPFSRLMDEPLLADLRAAQAGEYADDAADDAADHPEVSVSHLMGTIIRRHWIAQFVRPLPIPPMIDAHTGEPLLLITDHYQVKDWAALQAALATQADIEGDRAHGWAKHIDCADGQVRQSVAINIGKGDNEIDVFFKTQAYADAGRPWFEALAGDSVAFTSRVLTDPQRMTLPLPGDAQDDEPGLDDEALNFPAEAMSAIFEKVVLRTYANWADEPIPMLGNLTPRAAIKSPAGRERVLGLLRTYEQDEREQAAEQNRRPVSFDFLWASLGLKRPA